MGLVKVMFIGVSMAVLDSVGRRPLLIFGSFGSALSLVMVGLGSHHDLDVGVLAVIGTFAYVAFFSIGFGPVCWLYASELFPSTLRSKGMSLCFSAESSRRILAKPPLPASLQPLGRTICPFRPLCCNYSPNHRCCILHGHRDERKNPGGDLSPKGTQELWRLGSECFASQKIPQPADLAGSTVVSPHGPCTWVLSQISTERGGFPGEQTVQHPCTPLQAAESRRRPWSPKSEPSVRE